MLPKMWEVGGVQGDLLARHALAPDAKPSRAPSRVKGDEPRDRPKFSELMRFSHQQELTWGSLVSLQLVLMLSFQLCFIHRCCRCRSSWLLRCFASVLTLSVCHFQSALQNADISRITLHFDLWDKKFEFAMLISSTT